MSENALKLYYPPESLAKNAAVSGMEGYRALVKQAEEDYEGYWANHARNLLDWHTPFTQVLDESEAPFFKWFADGKLNVSYNCIDRQVNKGLGDKVAIIFEADSGEVTKITYKDLLGRVCKMANALKSIGVVKGDRVVIYLPMSIEGIVAMQACARIGATHSVVFGGFSAQSLRDRIEGAGATALITSDGQFRGGKALPLKPIADEALAMGGCDTIKNVLIVKRTGADVNMVAGRDLWLDEVMAAQADTCEPEWVDAEHPLFLLYTSGSTGKPKGVQHASGGYLLQAMLSMQYTFDIKPDDIFWCTADIG
ncbi:MAG: AMP-binding protein, partial [Rhodocyclaceae bacterium]|nr:AMP-binding protein [Rhodocyclaceae bacterium]